jgi:4-hydroxymandelate oxidase
MTSEPLNLFEYEELARAVLPPDQYDFIAGGAADELSLERPRQVFDSLLLRTRVLVDVAKISMETTVLEDALAMPVLLAPSGFHARAHPDAEAATARAAAEAGITMVAAANSSITLEELSAAAAGPKWFQLGLYRDRGLNASLAHRAAAAGYRALCLTLDSPPYPPRRERNLRSGYRQEPSPNFGDQALAPTDWTGGAARRSGAHALLDNSATWDDLARFVEDAPLPVVAKGVMDADDAQRCFECGVRALVVSNHGARNLDTTPAPIEVLPEIADRVAGRGELLVDGGVRRGTDIVKALALGARAVLIGRPIYWGLAAGGADGLTRLLGILRAELLVALAMCGQTDARNVDPRVVRA